MEQEPSAALREERGGRECDLPPKPGRRGLVLAGGFVWGAGEGREGTGW